MRHLAVARERLMFFFSKCRTSHRNTRWSVDPWHDPPSPVYRCDLVIYWWLIYIISKAGNGDPRLFPIRNINIFRGGLQTEPNKIAFFLLFYFNFPFQLMRKKKEKERKKKKDWTLQGAFRGRDTVRHL